MLTLEGEQFFSLKLILSFCKQRERQTNCHCCQRYWLMATHSCGKNTKKSRTEADTMGELTISTSTKGWRKVALKNEKLIQCSKKRRSWMATQNQGGKSAWHTEEDLIRVTKTPFVWHLIALYTRDEMRSMWLMRKFDVLAVSCVAWWPVQGVFLPLTQWHQHLHDQDQ